MEAVEFASNLVAWPITMGTTNVTQPISAPARPERMVSRAPALSSRPSRAITLATAAGLLIGGTAAPALSNGNLPERLSAHQNVYSAAKDRRRATLERLRERISFFARRQVDWDGLEGVAPSEDAQQDALSFIEALPAGSLPSETYAPGDGEILFQWSNPDYFLEVGFYGDGTISWYCRTADGEELFGDDEYAGPPFNLPGSLTSILMI